MIKFSVFLANFIFIVLYISQTFCLAGQPENNPEKYCILAGSIHNPKHLTISINNLPVNLNSDGQFLYKFLIDKPGYIDINMGKEIAVYIKTGDILYLEINPDKDLKYIKVMGTREKINQFLVQEASESEHIIEYFNKNYKEIFRLNEKDYKEKLKDLVQPFDDRLEKFIELQNITDSYFIKSQRAMIQYSWANNLYNYPNWHRRFSEDPAYQPDPQYDDFLDNLDLNDPELIDLKEYKTFLNTYLGIKTEEELKNSQKYEDLNYKSFRAKMEVALDTFHDPIVRSEMLYSFMRQFFSEYYHKDIDDLIASFRQNCTNETYLSEINKSISYDKSVRDKCLIRTYKQVDDISLDVFIYLPKKVQKGKRSPALAFYHGGGWECGKPEWGDSQCLHFASLGMVCFSFEYRLKTQHDVTPLECIADAKSAIRWIREHAEEFGIDPEKIVASGFSAGGHLSLCTAMIDKFDEPDEDQSVSSSANALLLWVTPVRVFADGWFKEILKGKAKVSDCDPAEYIRADLPPSIIFQGTADNHIPLWSVKEFVKNMEAAGNRCELHLYEGQTHLGWGDNEVDVLNKMDAFLASIKYIRPNSD
jgi:acetyl esterase/lipase